MALVVTHAKECTLPDVGPAELVQSSDWNAGHVVEGLADEIAAILAGMELDAGGPGVCKAWVNFNGVGAISIREQFNVASITDLGAGVYRVNFAAPLASANYAAFASSSRASGSKGRNTSVTMHGDASADIAPTVNGFTFHLLFGATFSAADAYYISAAAFGQ